MVKLAKHLIIALTLLQAIFLFSEANGNKKCLTKNGNSICLTPECIQSSALILSYLDESVSPCEDFYKFACGGYLKERAVPDDRPAFDQLDIIDEKIIKQLRNLIEEPSQLDEPRPFTIAKKYYNLCMNVSAIEEDNLQSAKTFLESLGGWPVLDNLEKNENEFDWKLIIYKYRKLGGKNRSILSVSVDADVRNSSARIIYCDEPALRLHREYLVKGFEDKFVAAHYSYLTELAITFGAGRVKAEKDMKEVVEFEIALAKATTPTAESRNLAALYSLMTVEELQNKYPSIPWAEYLTNIMLTSGITIEPTDVVSAVPKYFGQLENLLKQTPKRVLVNYVLSYTVIGIARYLNKDIRDLQLKMKRAYLGNIEMKPRWKECMDDTVVMMNIASASMYVRKYFNEAAKSKATNLVNNVLSEFRKMLQDVEWMDDDTKKKALEKASKINAYVAYPSEFLDDKKLDEFYSNLGAEENNYFGLAMNIAKFREDMANKELREPVNKSSWIRHARAARANAYFSQVENSLELPAAILQGMFFNSDRPQYLNYGALGFIIGHEITHGFDDKGRLFDQDGSLENWWGEQTGKAYLEKVQCIVDQYSNYTDPETGLKLNGKLTQGENIADNGGAREAYLAYKEWVARHGEELYLPGLNYTPIQLFWISLAGSWCSKDNKEYVSRLILTDTHLPCYWRINGALKNSEEFSKDFNCPLGSDMNLENKCRVW